MLTSRTYHSRDIRLDFVYLFIAKFALVYIHTASVSFAAIGTTKALRVDFLRSLLRQDMTYFDTKAGDSASIQVTTNGNIINNGISDKFSLTMQALATFVSACKLSSTAFPGTPTLR